MRRLTIAVLCLLASTAPVAAESHCGELVMLTVRGTVQVGYSLAGPRGGAPAALVLLPGGTGDIDLDSGGCAQKLRGNSLIRKRPLFHAQGFVTALVDAPSDRRGGDGLGGFRVATAHAEDIGKVIADVRRRTKLPVWLVGTSRGAISAANAAARLKGAAAPDGLVLTSPVTSGREGGAKAWVAQTVFSVPLEAIELPVLAVAHAADQCIRTPPALIGRIASRTNGAREQTVTVTGGPGSIQGPSVEACEGRSPHGFIGQEADVVAGIARFVRGGRY